MEHQGLATWMAAHVPGFAGPLRLHRLSGGQSNPTWRAETPERSYVIRQKPLGAVQASAHAVEREFRVMAALRASAVPVPEMIAQCEDPAVFGSVFFVMEHLEGRSFLDPSLPGHDPAGRAAIFAAMNDAIAAISMVDPLALGLGDYGRQGGYVARQVARWTKQYRAAETQALPAMEDLIAWLPQHLPTTPEELRIVHGDFRLDNLIFHPTQPKVLAVVDWELSTLGCPYADFAYNVMTWRIPTGLFRGLAGADLAGLGLPSEQDYIAQWCQSTGRKLPAAFDFYIILSMFRIASILQGIAKRAADGTAADPRAAQMGAMAGPLAELACQAIARR